VKNTFTVSITINTLAVKIFGVMLILLDTIA